METNTELGKRAEELAIEYLQGLGYEIKAINWHYCHLEIDIVARDGRELVIVEVKSRKWYRFAHPADAINEIKINRLIDAAEAYIQETGSLLETRFDLITIIFFDQEHELEHFKDAFYPTL